MCIRGFIYIFITKKQLDRFCIVKMVLYFGVCILIFIRDKYLYYWQGMMLDLCIMEDDPVWIRLLLWKPLLALQRCICMNFHNKCIYRFRKLKFDRIYHKRIKWRCISLHKLWAEKAINVSPCKLSIWMNKFYMFFAFYWVYDYDKVTTLVKDTSPK